MTLTDEEIHRYARHIVLPQVGGKGQEAIRNASVLVVGAGGLGSSQIYYLAAAGVGTITVLDCDVVEISNLHRQILHRTDEVGTDKVEAAARRVRDLNPNVQVKPIAARLNRDNVLDFVKNKTVVLDGVDNAAAKLLLNDACVQQSVPLVHAGAVRFEGQVTTLYPGRGPCLRCLYVDSREFENDTRDLCSEAGILGSVAGMIGSIQATEALKIILGIGDPLIGRMMVINALDARIRTVRYNKRHDCPQCGSGRSD